MIHRISTQLTYALFFCALLAGLSLISAAKADTCTEISGGTCKSHGTCDSGDTTKHCRDTLKSDGYHCVCRTGKDNKPHHGPDISFGIGIGPGGGLSIGIGSHGGVGFDIGTGGYCDHWGCPGDYWGYPVYYGSVYYDGEWFEGPVYYREYDGEYEYWVHGNWHRDEWRGERPEWAGEGHYGPALGRDYYRSDEFRNYHEHGDDWNREDHHEGDHRYRGQAGINWQRDHDGDRHDNKHRHDDKNSDYHDNDDHGDH